MLIPYISFILIGSVLHFEGVGFGNDILEDF